MIISLILLFFISREFICANKTKQHFIIFVFFIYTFFSIFELIYLNTDYSRSIHFSDPTDYYHTSKQLKSFNQIFVLESTNVFYFIINYFYINIYDSEVAVSLLVRLNNILLLIYTYLLLSQVTNRVRKIDYLFVFNPYLLLIAIRNVRDLYILLFVVLLLLSIGALPKSTGSFSRSTLLFSIIMLILVRPVCLIPFGFIYLLKSSNKHRYLGKIAIITTITSLFVFREMIIAKVMNQFISAGDYVGEDVSEYNEMLDEGLSGGGILSMSIRIIKAVVALIFTPHPIKYFNSWIANADHIGTYNIYTGFDNILIVVGSIFIYVYILPLVIELFLQKEIYKKASFQYAIIFALIYALAYLGITDIRNHYLVYIFLLFPVFSSRCDIRPTRISQCIIIGVFFFLMIL